MISSLVGIELCETACLSALSFQKISQMGFMECVRPGLFI